MPNTYGYSLEPRYDSRKSFYGKARVIEVDGGKTLVSYNTEVARIKDGKAVVYGTYSSTTLRHIKDFLKQNGFKAETSSQIMKDYGSEKVSNESDESESKSHLRTVYSTAMLGNVMYKDQKERNDYKYRILKAGLENRGISFPENWDSLSEDEKEKRLNNALKQIKPQ